MDENNVAAAHVRSRSEYPHVESSEKEAAKNTISDPENGKLDDDRIVVQKKELIKTRPGPFLFALLCCSLLLVLSLDRFLTHRTNLPLALADAQAFIARNAINTTCQYPKYAGLGPAVSGGILWRTVSFAAIPVTVASVFALWFAFAEEDDNVLGILWALNALEFLLSVCYFFAYICEPDSPVKCHGDECWSICLFHIAVMVSWLTGNAIVTIWYCRGIRGIWREIQAIRALLRWLILAPLIGGVDKSKMEN